MSAVEPRVPGLPRLSRAVRDSPIRTALEHAFFGAAPIAAVVFFVAMVIHSGNVAVDFHNAYWPAGERLIRGLSPYGATGAQIADGQAFVYPAAAALLFGPFALVSLGVSQLVFMGLCIAMVPGSLWVLGVRDWRVYGVVMLWLPVFGAWQTANLTMPLVLALALIWRYRDRPALAGPLVALAISLKLFVWPIALWLLCTRRWRAAAWALGSGLILNLVAWSVVGFGDLRLFLHLSDQVTAALWRGGYGVPAVAARLGLSHGVGSAIELCLVALLIAAVFIAGRRRRDCEQALVFTVALMLVASPLIWSHYFALLLVPMAIIRPRLGALWLLPLAMWVCPPRTGVLAWEAAVAWLVTVTCLYSLSRTSA